MTFTREMSSPNQIVSATCKLLFSANDLNIVCSTFSIVRILSLISGMILCFFLKWLLNWMEKIIAMPPVMSSKFSHFKSNECIKKKNKNFCLQFTLLTSKFDFDLLKNRLSFGDALADSSIGQQFICISILVIWSNNKNNDEHCQIGYFLFRDK